MDLGERERWAPKNALQYSQGLLFISCGAFFLLNPENLFVFSGILVFAGLGAAGAYLLILTMKAAIGNGSTIAGFLLREGGYQALESQTQTTEFIIRLTMCGIPTAGSLVSVAILALPCFRLSRKTTFITIKEGTDS